MEEIASIFQNIKDDEMNISWQTKESDSVQRPTYDLRDGNNQAKEIDQSLKDFVQKENTRREELIVVESLTLLFCQICNRLGHMAENCSSSSGTTSPSIRNGRIDEECMVPINDTVEQIVEVECCVCQGRGYTNVAYPSHDSYLPDERNQGLRDSSPTVNTKTEEFLNVNVVTTDKISCQLSGEDDHLSITCSNRSQNKEDSYGLPKTGEDTLVCQECNKRGHRASICFKLFSHFNKRSTMKAPTITVCQLCHKQGHSANSCFQLSSAMTKNLRIFPPTCQICKKIGHIATNCRRLTQSGFPPLINQGRQLPQGFKFREQIVVKCQICKKRDHDGRECSYRYDESRNSGTNNSMRDAGADRKTRKSGENYKNYGLRGHVKNECRMRKKITSTEKAGPEGKNGQQMENALAEIEDLDLISITPTITSTILNNK